MSTRALSMDEWEQAVRGAIEEMSEAVLGRAAHEVPLAELEPGTCGAYIPLLSLRDSLRMGVIASPQGCEAIAGWLAGTTGAGRLQPAEVADAMCEFLNIVAGAVKRRIAHKLPSLRVGLPIFLTGAVHATGAREASEQALRVGHVPLLVAILRYRSNGGDR